MPGDLILLIAWRVLSGDFLDYVRFRAVCTHWRSATVCPRGRGIVDPRFHPRRWMMFPEGHGLYPGHGKLRGCIRFFNLDTGTFVRVQLGGLFRNHCVLDSADGLLVLQRDEDTAVRLLHPFTGDIADLPPLATLQRQLDPLLVRGSSERLRWFYIRSVFASACSIGAAGTITVILALDRIKRVAFATTGDQQWTLSSWMLPNRSKQLSSRGKLYVVASTASTTYHAAPASQIFQIETPLQDGMVTDQSSLPAQKLIATCPDKLCSPINLVESDSEILVVGYNDNYASRFSVYRLTDLILGKFVPLKSIEDRAIFLDLTTISVSAKALPTVVADTIVYSHLSELYVAQYDLGTGTFSQALDDCHLLQMALHQLLVVSSAISSPVALLCTGTKDLYTVVIYIRSNGE